MGRNAALLAAILLWLVAPMANAEILVIPESPLSGVLEVPPNNSEGAGNVKGLFDTTTKKLTIRVDYAGLDGTTTGAHIHCCAKPGVNSAPPIMRGDTFKAFLPLGKTRGSTDPQYEENDLSHESAWDKDFYRDAGGTVDKATTKLADALKKGEAYFNIKTTAAPNGEVRANLGPTTTVASILAAAARLPDVRFLLGPNDLECNDFSERCLIPIYVRKTGPYSCDVRLDFKSIAVKAHADPTKRVRVVWLLVSGDLGDKTDFRFSSNGVQINATSTGIPHDPTKDFNSPGEDDRDARRFKWHSVNKRQKEKFLYDVNVDMYDSAGKRWPCRQADPVIMNL